ncbi:hypothetical protein FB567DRAFT_584185 [Paraphoma chrysanthemicola]|uniref:Fumarylacetoacetase-like C-terminal domain-containing protein n=1 Tax=Paraphoma chrysanthemicola TaxID=798071 RepID=A0A8K0QV95_9PLEO|nr:hypothetical protein FB567DRAFT_584185 [Paraphoma chrysanthemicola]
MSNSWTHLVRFIAEEDRQIHIGQVNALTYPDVGLAHRNGEKIEVNLITGSIYDGIVTNKKLHIRTLLSPLSVDQIPIIRCLGLNYKDHAREANMPIPDYPVLFIKPRTALNGPFPAKINIPKVAQDDTADYEAELSFIIGKDGKDIAESEALEYVLGYTASNDVSARTEQLRNSQWCFGKGICAQSTKHEFLSNLLTSWFLTGMDGSCPIGPVLVSGKALVNPEALQIKAIYNSNVVQDSNTREMIFGIAKTISFLSQGTTLERGTIIMTGTGPGIGMTRDPRIVLRHGDVMEVFIEGIGTLLNEVVYE